MTSDHEHHWVTASEHATSEGWIIYQRCTCTTWRVLHRHNLTTLLTTTH